MKMKIENHVFKWEDMEKIKLKNFNTFIYSYCNCTNDKHYYIGSKQDMMNYLVETIVKTKNEKNILELTQVLKVVFKKPMKSIVALSYNDTTNSYIINDIITL